MIKKILLAGDTHGDLHQMKYLYGKAVDHEVDAIVVLGDFGYWEHQASGFYFLNWISETAIRRNIPTYFVDGNHENHTLLRYRYMGITPERGVTEQLQNQVNVIHEKTRPWTPTQNLEGFWAIRNGLWYIPRSTVWVWNNIRFAALGGAFSVDINWRKPGTSWWPEEMIEPDEVEALREVGKVDVFLSHDCPEEVDMLSIFANQNSAYFKADQRSLRNRALLSKAVEYTEPHVLYHGHYHMPHETDITLHSGHQVRVIGLDRDGTEQRSFTVLSLENPLTDSKE